MSAEPPRVPRRLALQAALAGGALCVGASLGCSGARGAMIRRAGETGELATDAFVTILPSGEVSLAVHKTEIGQGVATAYVTLVAEELEVEPTAVHYHFADSLPEFRTTGVEGVPLFAIHATGGSTSVWEGYLPLRQSAAAAREMLVAAAAEAWGVEPSACAARGGRVVHDATGRSVGYGALTRSAAQQPVPENPPLKARADFKQIGKIGRRVDVRAKVTGAARYGIDVVVPNMVAALSIHGPRFGARPSRVKADAARKVPGVIDVLQMPWGVAVVAAKYWQALRAAPLVEIDWEDGEARGFDSERMLRAARAYDREGAPVRDDGDVDDAVDDARASSPGSVVEVVYEAPYLAHAPLEPQNCTARVTADGAELWAPCQSQSVIQELVATELGIDPRDVLVHTTFVGGGFGRRLLGDFAVEAASIAKKIGRPVKLVWSRESDMSQGYYRPAAITKVRGAVGADGRASAFSFHTLSQPITLDSSESLRAGQPPWLPAFLRSNTARATMGLAASNTVVDMFACEGVWDTPYSIPNLRVAYTPIAAPVSVASWRSVAHSINAFVVESAIDELAHAAKKDPYQFRRAHLAPGSRELRVLDAVARRAGWGSPSPAGHALGIARQTAFRTEAAEVAEVCIVGGRIRVTRVWCVAECGVVVNPDIVHAQLEGGIVFGLAAALDQEITVKDGVVQQTSYDGFPVLRIDECPKIDVAYLDSDAEPTGIGEPGVPPIAPAVANAIFALTGKRLRTLPLQRAFDAAVGR